MTNQIKPPQGAITAVLAVFCGPLRGLPYIYLPSVSVVALASRLLLHRSQSPCSPRGVHRLSAQLPDFKSRSGRVDFGSIWRKASGKALGKASGDDQQRLRPENSGSQILAGGHSPAICGVVADGAVIHHLTAGVNDSVTLTGSSSSEGGGVLPPPAERGVGLHKRCGPRRLGLGVIRLQRRLTVNSSSDALTGNGCQSASSGIGFHSRCTAQTCHWHFLALPARASGTHLEQSIETP